MEKCQEELIVKAINVCETNGCELAVIYLKQFMLANQAKPNCKVDLYNLCYKGDFERTISGIYHDKGYIVATDGYILAKIKEEYPEELEGKIITKYGDEIEGIYPNYQKVIGNFDEMTDVSVNKEKVLEAVKQYKLEKKIGGICQKQVLCKAGKQYFKAEMLLKFLLLCESEKMQIREAKDSERAIMGKNTETGSESLLMPVYVDRISEPILIDCNN
jgi:hypothetical protein